MDQIKDSPWYFQLGTIEEYPSEEKALAHFFQDQINGLLRTIVFIKDGKRVQIDGFCFFNEPNKVYDISLQRGERGADSRVIHYDWSEPRLRLLLEELRGLLSLVQLEHQGKPVEIDGFRIRDLSALVTSLPDESCEAFTNLMPLAYGCNLDCIFCFAKFFHSYALTPHNYCKSIDEIRDRLRYYSPEEGKGLPLSGIQYLPWEPFIHPHFMEILELVSVKAPHQTIYIETNGSFLSKETVRQLARFPTLELMISLNSSNPRIRQKIMRDPHPEVAIKSLPLLQEYGIKFNVSVVPLPWLTGWSDLEQTLRYADCYQPGYIRLALPAYSRYSPPEIQCNEENLMEIVKFVDRLRWELMTPILPQPALFNKGSLAAQIEGVYRNSLAHKAGLRYADQILEINHQPINSRTHANQLLSKLSSAWMQWLRLERAFTAIGLNQREWIYERVKGRELTLKIKRGERIIEIDMAEVLAHQKEISNALFRRRFGIILPDDFDFAYLDKVRELIDVYKAKRPLVLTSRLIRPLFEQAMKETLFRESLPSGVRLFTAVPRNIFFGGNVMLGDLMVVSDFIQGVKTFIQRNNIQPDLILIPSSPFNSWGLDLCCRSYLEIESELGIRVELIPCTRILY